MITATPLPTIPTTNLHYRDHRGAQVGKAMEPAHHILNIYKL